MDIKPDAIALRNAEFYKSNDITVKTDCEVNTFGSCIFLQSVVGIHSIKITGTYFSSVSYRY
jgi:hypothetical protein